MRKINSQRPPHKLSIPSSSGKNGGRPQDYFSSIDGILSFYSIKSNLRTPLLKNITIKGFLNEDGEIVIYLNQNEIIEIPIKIKENHVCKYGLETILLPNTLFFKGSLMDGFNYEALSEDISTFIVNGNMVSFKKAERATSIGKLKRIHDVIHLNSSFSVITKNEEITKVKKYSKLDLGVDISMQFKHGAA